LFWLNCFWPFRSTLELLMFVSLPIFAGHGSCRFPGRYEVSNYMIVCASDHFVYHSTCLSVAESRIFYLETKYCCKEGGDLGESLEVVGKKKVKRGESEVREVWRKSHMFWLLGRKKKIF
jgi:hypothetical protein